MSYESFDRFTALVAPWQNTYRHATFSYYGIRTSRGVHLLFGRIKLELTVPQLDAFHLKTRHIVAARFTKSLDAQQTQQILTEARSGKLSGLEGVIALPPETNDFDSYWIPGDCPFPSSVIVRGARFHGPPFSECRDVELNWELKASDAPFDTNEELFAFLSLPRTRGGLNEYSELEINASLPAEIDQASVIINGKAIVQIRASKALQTDRLKLGWQFSHKGTQREAGSISGHQLQWKVEAQSMLASHEVDVGASALLRAYLSYEELPLHRQAVPDPKQQLNPRRAVHCTVDSELRLIEQVLLNPAKKEAEDFERAVTVLLSLLGFSAIHYGLMREFKDGPDIVAFAPDGNVVVADCTIGFIDNKDKISKLVGRVNQIETQLRDAGHGNVRVLPMIITCLSRGQIMAEIPKAAELRIAVMCKEELEAILKQVASSPNAGEFFKQAIKLIPLNPSDPFGSLIHA